MPRNSPNPISAPAAVVDQARRLGANIALARKRRRLPQAVLATKAGITRQTLRAVEAGELRVSLGTCLAVLWALGLDGGLNAVASPETDREGMTLESARLGQRMRARTRLSDDF
jgi:DNA-binding XRE family transcriptional regulator